MHDPTGRYPDTTATDPWPMLRLAPGLYKCASFTQAEVWYLVDIRQAARPVCAHPHWNGQACKHIQVVQAQAPDIEAAWGNDGAAAEVAA